MEFFERWKVARFGRSNFQCCRPSADRELTVLLDVLSQCDSQSEKLGEWDLQYLSAVYRQKAYGNIGAISR